jgi:Flp pilus assembly protein TadG
MAVVFPLLLTTVMGMIEMGRLGMVCQLMTTAARDACRVAILDWKTQTDVQNRVNQVLSNSGISVGTVNPTPSNWTSLGPGQPITVTLSVPYSKVSWLPTPWFLKGATVTVSATLCSEKLQSTAP